MIISGSSIQLFSEHTSIEQSTQKESLTVWRGASPDRNNRTSKAKYSYQSERLHSHSDHIGLSQKAKNGQPQRAIAEPVDEADIPNADLNIRILRAMIQKISGKVIDIRLPQDVAIQENTAVGTSQPLDVTEQSSTGSGLEYDYYESHYEYESTSFNAQGVISTEDGREIDFSVELNMSREFMQEKSINIKAGDALKDPLAVNFSGSAAELSDTTFRFDIDMDGRDDQIAFTSPGSGFLALDKNGDGTINNGSELFGPATGDGFAELAAYDDDSNGWIDENDDIFQHLRIWTRDAAGESSLFSLGEKGVGAIYLNHINTPFSIKNNDNALLGQVRDSGVFVNENGSVGTIQQVDLAV